jgi:hypothetical protein
MNPKRREPQDTTRPKRPTTGVTAFERACQRYSSMRPEGRSVAAFARWMRSTGHARVWTQEDLFLEYLCIQEMIGSRPLPLKRFGRALAKAGFIPKQADWEKDGKRWRPMIVDLAAAKHELSIIATTATTATSDTPAKSRITTDRMTATSDRSVPWPELPMRKAA